MKKKIIVITITLIVLSVILLNINDNKTFTKDNILYAVNVDGAPASSIPSNGDYMVDVVCTNADASWLYDEWKLSVEKVTGKVSCKINFTTRNENLNEYIISLSGTTQGEGQLVNENGYRYQGEDPNNYIWFNNELWRVIGVFDNTSHGIEGETLVKIIRNEPIGGLAWDAGNVNDWNESSLKELLNNEYYNALNGNTSANCRGYSTSVPANCDYTVYGLQSGYRELIEEVTWYLGGMSSAGTAETVYNAERGTVVYSGRPLSGTGKIGLMYLSDYGYSVLSSSCVRTTNLSSYNSSTCAGSSWLYGNGYEWTITPHSSNASIAWSVRHSGRADDNFANYGFSGRPVSYLKSNVKVLDGSGNKADPFIIK